MQVQMTLSNPLNISLCVENLSLTYSFNKELTLVEPQVLDELLLAPSSTTQVNYFNNILIYLIIFFYEILGNSWFESAKCGNSNYNWS